jgi:surfactin family lipopeptide synthetase C
MSGKPSHNIADIYPLSPAQQGMLFHTLYAPEAGLYRDQLACRLEARQEIDQTAFESAWQEIVSRHSILRTAFVWERREAPIQIVLRSARPEISWEDWRGFDTAEQEARWNAHLRRCRGLGLDLSRPPLLRLSLVRCSERAYRLVMDYHHMLMDAPGGAAPRLPGQSGENPREP